MAKHRAPHRPDPATAPLPSPLPTFPAVTPTRPFPALVDLHTPLWGDRTVVLPVAGRRWIWTPSGAHR
jgi:hypothetical protein